MLFIVLAELLPEACEKVAPRTAALAALGAVLGMNACR